MSSADNGRNDVVLRRVQSQCSNLGLENVKVPNKVRNERLPWALSLSGVPQSGHVACVEKGGDLLLEEVALEGAKELFGLGQA